MKNGQTSHTTTVDAKNDVKKMDTGLQKEAYMQYPLAPELSLKYLVNFFMPLFEHLSPMPATERKYQLRTQQTTSNLV